MESVGYEDHGFFADSSDADVSNTANTEHTVCGNAHGRGKSRQWRRRLERPLFT